MKYYRYQSIKCTLFDIESEFTIIVINEETNSLTL